MDEKRVLIIIDGSNLYHKFKDLGIENKTYFEYSKFCDWLARGRNIISKGYYVGAVRTKQGDEASFRLWKNQVRLFNHLNSPKQGFYIKRGYLMRSDGKYHEKGVDVQMAVDLLVGAYENKYDVAIIISSDTDLIPAIKKIKNLGKEVEYIGFAHKPSLALQTFANISRLVIKDELEPFVFKSDKRL